MEQSDEMLVALYLNGDESALSHLIERYFNPIYRYVYRFVRTAAAAEDVVQETFIKVWKSARSLKEGATVKPWLYRIAHNTAIDYLRKKKQLNFSEMTQDAHAEALFSDDTVDILEQTIAREERAALTATIEALPAHYREVILLRGTENLSFEEISTIIDKPIATVRSLYRRGLLLLQKQLS